MGGALEANQNSEIWFLAVHVHLKNAEMILYFLTNTYLLSLKM